MILRATLVWLLLVAIAIANGLVREAVLTPRWGAATGHVVSSLTLSGLIVFVAWLTIGWVAPASAAAGFVAGGWWLLLTVGFEFGFGRWRGRGWDELLADYDLSRGRIWLLVLVATFLSPWLVGRWRGLWTAGS